MYIDTYCELNLLSNLKITAQIRLLHMKEETGAGDVESKGYVKRKFAKPCHLTSDSQYNWIYNYIVPRAACTGVCRYKREKACPDRFVSFWCGLLFFVFIVTIYFAQSSHEPN